MFTLRELQDSDVAQVAGWLAQDYVAKWFGDVSDWLEEIHGRNGEYSFIRHFIAQWDGIPAGFCQYYDWNRAFGDEEGREPPGSFGIDYVIGEPSLLGRGCGRLLVEAVCEKVIAREPRVVQLIADPTMEEGKINLLSVKALEAAGFQHNREKNYYFKRIE